MQFAKSFSDNLVIKVNHSQVILGLVFLMFLADGANSLLESVGAPFYRVSIFVRSLALIYFLWLTLQTNASRRLLKVVSFFYAIFVVGTLAAQDLVPNYNLLENISLLHKFLFVFICWVTFSQFFKGEKESDQLFRVFELIIWIEVITVLLGFIFRLDVLSSYGNRRFGYKGLIPAQNEVSGFFLIAFFYYLAKVDYLGKNVIMLVVVLITGIITGTKVALILPVILIIQIIYWFTRNSVRAGYVFLFFGFILLLGTTVYYWDHILARLAPTINYYAYRITHEDYSPFVIVGSSGRLILIDEFFSNYFPKYNIINIAFGGQDLTSFSTETDVIDVFARFGLIGLFAFYVLYLRLLITDVTKVYQVRLLFAVTWIGISALAGHLVFSAINGGYLAILLMKFKTLEANHERELR